MNNLSSHRPARRFAGLLTVIGLCFALSSPSAVAGPYDFDDDNKNDMRSAWLMCATVGFTLGECPSVFVNCWKPPLIYLSCKRGRCKIKTHCLKLPSWNTSDSAIQNALAYAEANAPPAVAYSSATPAATPTELVPPICLDIPELCPTAEQEALYEAEDAALAACLETPGADCSGFGAGFDDGPGLPAICTDNPGLCDDIEIVVEEDDAPVEPEIDPNVTHPICEDNPGLCDDVLAGSR